MTDSSRDPAKEPTPRGRRRRPERPKELVDLDNIVGDVDERDAGAPRADRRMSLSEFSADRRAVEKARGGIAGVAASAESVRRRQMVRYGLAAAVSLAVLVIVSAIWYFLPENRTGKRMDRAEREIAAIRKAIDGLKLAPLPRRKRGPKLTRADQITRALRALANASEAAAVLQPDRGAAVALDAETALVAEWNRKTRRVVLRPEVTPARMPLARLRWDAKKPVILVSWVHVAKGTTFEIQVGDDSSMRPGQTVELATGQKLRIGMASWWTMKRPKDILPADFPVALRDPWDRLYQIEADAPDDDLSEVKVTVRSRGPRPDDESDDIKTTFTVWF